MKTIALHGKNGEGKFTLVSDEDYEMLSQWDWLVQIDHRTRHIQYVTRTHAGKDKIFMHRLIMGDKKGLVIDHINRNTLDNRRENLRHVTSQENMRNSSIWKSSPAVGVTKNRNKFQAQAVVNGKNKYLGIFNTIEEASKRYQDFKKENL